MTNDDFDPAEVAGELLTLRDYLRFAVSRFEAAALVYGHGTANAFDEATFLILEALDLPIDQLDPFLDARLTRAERAKLAGLIAERVRRRVPAPYLVGRAYIQGVPFRVDERVIVPRSFIGEILARDLLGPEGLGLVENPDLVGTVLDLCTGSGAIAVLAALAFPNASVDATDLSADALAVAEENLAELGLEERIALLHGDLFAPVDGRRYDVILSNPPYVGAEAMAALPAEFRHEPAMALAGGEDGLDLVRRILADAPNHLGPGGLLVVEIGSGREILEAEFDHLPFSWIDTEESSGEVFWLRAGDFPAARIKATGRGRAKRGR